MGVTSQYLLKGAVYALEQCGLLLIDAVSLINQKSYSSAIVLAAFAREELGRSRILTNFFDETVKNGKSITIKKINKTCEDHVVKQHWGQLSTTLRFKNDSGIGKLIMTRNQYLRSNLQNSEDFQKVEQQINKVTAKLKKRTPDDRHRARAKALYVLCQINQVRIGIFPKKFPQNLPIILLQIPRVTTLFIDKFLSWEQATTLDLQKNY